MRWKSPSCNIPSYSLNIGLLYNAFRTVNPSWFLCFCIQKIPYASAVLHPSISCWYYHNDFTCPVLCIEGLPIAILSDQIWIGKAYFIIRRLLGIQVPWIFVCISQTSYVHILLWSSEWHVLICIVHWRSPSCNTLWADLNAKSYFIISSVQPMSVVFFVCASSVFRMHLPNFMCPYLALVINTTSPGLQCALKVSQLHIPSYSLNIGLLYNAFRTVNPSWFLCFCIQKIPYASAVLHPSISCWYYHNDFTCPVLCIEGLPIAILSDQIWIGKAYFIISSEQPTSSSSLVSASIVLLIHLPNFILPYLALVIRMTCSGLHCALKVSQLQYSLVKSE